jgi:hypothetical protein
MVIRLSSQESVLVQQPYFQRPFDRPTEDDAPLVVHADGVPTTKIAAQRLQAVSRGGPKVDQVLSGVQHVELAYGNSEDVRWKPTGTPSCATVKEFLCVPVAEGEDHTLILPIA